MFANLCLRIRIPRPLPRTIACVLALALVGGPARADRFRDPEDGRFDASTYLLEHKGALPLPILITEPAVGYGGGAALVFFQQSLAELAAQEAGRMQYRPPNIYMGAGFGTENGTWGAAAGTMLTFANDHWRLRAGAMHGHVNLNFYGSGLADLPGLGYTLDGNGVIVQVLNRLGRSHAWFAARAQFLDFTTTFDNASSAPFPEQQRQSVGLGPSVEFDTRDNLFTPNRGMMVGLAAMFYDPALGGDASFQTYRGHLFVYRPIPRRLVLGARLDGRSSAGDVPFYMVPFIDLRGIPKQRYQGQHTAVAEGELRWNATPRWALIGFGGVGRAWGPNSDFDAVDGHGAGGTGFRYLLARRLGVYSGLDFAWGPQFAFYLQVGSAWH